MFNDLRGVFRQRYWMGGGLAALLLACGVQPSVLPEQTPPATSDGIRFAIQVETPPGAEAVPVSSPQPELAATPTIPVSTATPAILPAPSPTDPPPAGLPSLGEEAATPTPIAAAETPAANIAAETPGANMAAETPGANIYTGNISDQIVLIGPDPAYSLPPDQDQLELKWQWLGTELRPCQLVEGHGFDIRLWPAPNNSNISDAQRAEIEPLGVIDAKEEQDTITASCDPRNGMRRFTVNGLSQTPGAAMAQGRGQFFWDVAYVQLEPFYTTLMVSAPRDFFIPPGEVEVATPLPSPSPTPTFQLTPGPKPAGTITLLDPAGKPTFPANVGPVEFRWKWDGQDSPPCELVSGYGFELRIGSTQPGSAAMGVFDAARQGLPACDPDTGIFHYTVLDLKITPGVKSTYVGEYRWDGQFFWDVVLVSTNPYQAPGPDSTVSPPGYFEISLSDYTGSFDPFGEPLKCASVGAWTEAQAIFLAAGGPAKDPHDFDSDGNQIACDDLRQ